MAWKDETAKDGKFDKEAALSKVPPSYKPEDLRTKASAKKALRMASGYRLQ